MIQPWLFSSPKTYVHVVIRLEVMNSSSDIRRWQSEVSQRRSMTTRYRLMERYVMIAFDMEKSLPLPTLNVGDGFCLRQLWMYNVGVGRHAIHNKLDKAYFH